MNLKIKIINIKNRFRELLKYKIFRLAVLLHLFYFVLALILTLVFFRDRNDFLVYYKVSEVVLNDINNLYNPPPPIEYRWPFRYFPLSVIFFIPFYLVGFDLGFILFNLSNFILNILICIILYKIILLVRNEDQEKDDKRVITYISIFLMGSPHIFNYILGQINLYVTLFILLSLYIILKYEDIKWQLIAGLLLGISISIKPITLLLIPFLIVFNYDVERKKYTFMLTKTTVRIIGVILPISLNILVFLIYPELLKDFISINFTGEDAIDINHSFSLTKIIENFLFFIGITEEKLLNFHILIFLFVLIIFGGIGFFVYLVKRKTGDDLIHGYLFGILIMLIAYFDAWDHHLLILMPFLIIIVFNLPRRSKLKEKIITPSIFFFSFLDLIFMGIWFFTKHLWESGFLDIWFPINFIPTIFLILIFAGICKFCLNKDQINQKIDLQSKS
ncbi:hypothetical protein LCGC14_1464580 [marine sediment metagenome]|uniref:Glycosyltransferase RgtA/B/C/D-like domain-containing protein n=1 Tax=marine sediment metagenome TaxID=412755 RepID=A0A0F9JEL8_9ZZZZ